MQPCSGHPKGENHIVAPRIVSSMSRASGSIASVTASETLTACLVSSEEIFIFHNYTIQKVILPQFILPRHLTYFVFSRQVPLKVVAAHESSLLIVTTSGDLCFWLPWMGNQVLPLEFPNQSDFRIIDAAMGVNNLLIVNSKLLGGFFFFIYFFLFIFFLYSVGFYFWTYYVNLHHS